MRHTFVIYTYADIYIFCHLSLRAFYYYAICSETLYYSFFFSIEPSAAMSFCCFLSLLAFCPLLSHTTLSFLHTIFTNNNTHTCLLTHTFLLSHSFNNTGFTHTQFSSSALLLFILFGTAPRRLGYGFLPVPPLPSHTHHCHCCQFEW